MKPRRSTRGAILIELALILPLAVSLILGAVHFGYLFYLYNGLEKSVRDGARYAASRTYTTAAAHQTIVSNVVVCGSSAVCVTPLVADLTLGMVSVTTPVLAADGRPERIKVEITGYVYNGVLSSLLGPTTLTGKPSMEIPFLGLYRPPA
ncbi:MAG TPA: TadE/TadG family type IV pilus assembly protein [Paludibaculum sp.]|jgi:Flp pilus assembly protein TadG